MIKRYLSKKTYKNQSTAIMSPMSSVGRFTAWRTMIMVTRPAEGIPAAPMAAAVAVILGKKRLITEVNDGQLVIRVAKSNAGKLCCRSKRQTTILDRTNWNRKPHSPEVKYSAARTPKRAIFPSLICGRAGRGVNFPCIFFPRF